MRRLLVRWTIVLAALLPAAPLLHATIVPYMDLGDLERGGEIVVLGTVSRADGAMSDDGRIIVTRVTIEVERALKGGARKTLDLEVPGGTLGGQTLVASGAPVFRKGERVVLFLGRSGNGAAAPLGIVGWNQGRFTVQRDPRTGRDIVTQPGGGALYVDGRGRPAPRDPNLAGPRVLEDFLRDVEAQVRRGAAADGGRP
jgi:hypothetical protein